MKGLSMDDTYKRRTISILEKYWLYLAICSESLIVGAVLLLSKIADEVNQLNFTEICEYIGIRNTTPYNIIRNHISKKFNLNFIEDLTPMITGINTFKP